MVWTPARRSILGPYNIGGRRFNRDKDSEHYDLIDEIAKEVGEVDFEVSQLSKLYDEEELVSEIRVAFRQYFHCRSSPKRNKQTLSERRNRLISLITRLAYVNNILNYDGRTPIECLCVEDIIHGGYTRQRSPSSDRDSDSSVNDNPEKEAFDSVAKRIRDFYTDSEYSSDSESNSESDSESDSESNSESECSHTEQSSEPEVTPDRIIRDRSSEPEPESPRVLKFSLDDSEVTHERRIRVSPDTDDEEYLILDAPDIEFEFSRETPPPAKLRRR